MTNLPSVQDLRAARDRFADLLCAPGTPEEAFQSLFAECPYVLSRSLPLRLSAAEILAQGKPGQPGADFLIYPHPRRVPFIYGAIEIKRPDSKIVTMPRRDVIVLSWDAATAEAQARDSAAKLRRQLGRTAPVCGIGTNEYLFLVIGLSGAIRDISENAVIQSRLADLLPRGCTLFTFDALLAAFKQTIPPRVGLLVPEVPWLPTFNLEWSECAQICVEYLRDHHPRPDFPDASEIAGALRAAGKELDMRSVLSLLSHLVDEGVVHETDSLLPPWETLYFVR